MYLLLQERSGTCQEAAASCRKKIATYPKKTEVLM